MIVRSKKELAMARRNNPLYTGLSDTMLDWWLDTKIRLDGLTGLGCDSEEHY